MRAAAILLAVLLAAPASPAAPAPEVATLAAAVPEPSPEPAAPAPDAATALDLSTAVRLALEHDPRLETLRAAVDVARAARRAVTAPANPEARLTYQEATEDKPAGGTGSRNSEAYEAALRVYPRRPWQSRAVSDSADAQIQAALADLRAGERLVTFEVRQAFRDVEYWDRDLAAVNRFVDAARQRQEALREMAAQQQAIVPDVMAADLKVLDALSAQAEVRRARSAAMRALADKMGAGGIGELKLEEGDFGARRIDPSALDPAALEAMAQEKRADLQALLWKARGAFAKHRAARGRRVPWFSFVQAGVGQASGANNRDEWSAQVGVDLPFFADPRDSSDETWAAYRQAHGLYEETRQLAVAEVRTALEALRDAAEQMVRQDRDFKPTVESLRKTLDDLRGLPNLDRATTAQIEEGLIKAERSLLEAQHAWETALVALEYAVGADLPAPAR